MNLQELKEQTQQDIIALMDGMDSQLVDAICQIIVDNVNRYQTQETTGNQLPNL